jgi:hypothetical protein
MYVPCCFLEEDPTLTTNLRHIPLFPGIRQPIRATISVASRLTACYQIQFKISV